MTKAYAAYSATEDLKPYEFKRRSLNENDVHIDIEYCGVCHSDLHTVRSEWGKTQYPIVPGHEIVGRIKAVGSAVTRHKVGDLVGVGCMVDSCQKCSSCNEGLEQYCETGFVGTYGGRGADGQMTQGGYSTDIIVREEFILKIPQNIAPEKAAPLLCAGITTYSPLKHWGITRGSKVAVMGLGGLGHMAVKLAVALGAEVSILSHSPKKSEDAKRLGATHFLLGNDPGTFKKFATYFDLIINTASGSLDLTPYMTLLKRDATMVLLGIPEKPAPINAFPLIGRRRHLAGSLIGGIAETQEMLDFCSRHQITPDIEMLPVEQVNTAYERMLSEDVRYRFVLDLKSLKS